MFVAEKGAGRQAGADPRPGHARYRGDRGIESLVTELLGTSPRFAAMWAAQEMKVRWPVACSPAPGSATTAAFRRLAAGINAGAGGFSRYG